MTPTSTLSMTLESEKYFYVATNYQFNIILDEFYWAERNASCMILLFSPFLLSSPSLLLLQWNSIFYFPVCCFNFLWFSISLKLYVYRWKQKMIIVLYSKDHRKSEREKNGKTRERERKEKFIKHVNSWKHLFHWWPSQAFPAVAEWTDGEHDTRKSSSLLPSSSQNSPLKVISSMLCFAVKENYCSAMKKVKMLWARNFMAENFCWLSFPLNQKNCLLVLTWHERSKLHFSCNSPTLKLFIHSTFLLFPPRSLSYRKIVKYTESETR